MSLTEAEMNVYFGWVQGSDMLAAYVHLSLRDVDEKILEVEEVKPRKKEKEDELRPIECPRCHYINSSVNRYCGRCGLILDKEERIKLELRSRQVSKDFPDINVDNAKLLEEMKRFRDMLELFEKNPELFKKMRAMIEES